MPRLRHKTTGAVVSVSEDTAALLADYEPAEPPQAPARKAPGRRKRPAASDAAETSTETSTEE